MPQLNSAWLNAYFDSEHNPRQAAARDRLQEACGLGGNGEIAADLIAWQHKAHEFLSLQGWQKLCQALMQRASLIPFIQDELNPASLRRFSTALPDGIYNMALIGRSCDSTYVRSLLHDLQDLATTDDRVLQQSILPDFLDTEGAGGAPRTQAGARQEQASSLQNTDTSARRYYSELVYSTGDIRYNKEQQEAIASMLDNKITVLQGPPGTGKTQVIAGAVINALALGQSVLIASTNHQAITAALERCAKDVLTGCVAVRANDDAGTDNSLSRVAAGFKLKDRADTQEYRTAGLRLRQLRESLCQDFNTLERGVQLTQQLEDSVTALELLQRKAGSAGAWLQQVQHSLQGLSLTQTEQLQHLLQRYQSMQQSVQAASATRPAARTSQASGMAGRKPAAFKARSAGQAPAPQPEPQARPAPRQQVSFFAFASGIQAAGAPAHSGAGQRAGQAPSQADPQSAAHQRQVQSGTAQPAGSARNSGSGPYQAAGKTAVRQTPPAGKAGTAGNRQVQQSVLTAGLRLLGLAGQAVVAAAWSLLQSLSGLLRRQEKRPRRRYSQVTCSRAEDRPSRTAAAGSAQHQSHSSAVPASASASYTAPAASVPAGSVGSRAVPNSQHGSRPAVRSHLVRPDSRQGYRQNPVRPHRTAAAPAQTSRQAQAQPQVNVAVSAQLTALHLLHRQLGSLCPPLLDRNLPDRALTLLQDYLKLWRQHCVLQAKLRETLSPCSTAAQFKDRLTERIRQEFFRGIRQVQRLFVTQELDAITQQELSVLQSGELAMYAEGYSRGRDELNAQIRDFGHVREHLAAAVQTVLRHRPLWFCSVLSARRYFPLLPGIFDLVIFDESAQTDFISALPLIYRARRVAFTGDPRQLAPIVNLPLGRQDLAFCRAGVNPFLQDSRALVCRQPLFDQYINSLWLCAWRCSQAVKLQLFEARRSCEAITRYISEMCYDGLLTPCTQEQNLLVPAGYRHGILWADVPNPVLSSDGSSRFCRSEAKLVAATAHDIIIRAGFTGSLGIITPYSAQAVCIREYIKRDAALMGCARGRTIPVATVHKFQGMECDVIILSLCLDKDGTNSFVVHAANLINVAVSRARSLLICTGSKEAALTSGAPFLEALVAASGAGTAVLRSRPSDDPAVRGLFESPLEKLLYDKMVQEGLKPLLQYPIGRRRLDFALIDESTGKYLDIEVDGACHFDSLGQRKADDFVRDEQLQSLDFQIKRFTGREVYRDPAGCARAVKELWDKMLTE